MSSNLFDEEITIQNSKYQAGADVIKIVNDLWSRNATEFIFFKNQLIGKGVTGILKLVDYATEFAEKTVTVEDVLEIAQTVKKMDISMARLDIGKLTYEYLDREDKTKTTESFIAEKLSGIKTSPEVTPRDVVLYGFGRIGRLVARELITKVGKGKQLRLKAIVVRGDLTEENMEKRASLLRNDSVHGIFPGTVHIDFEKKALIVNGITIYLINANNPEDIDYEQYGIKDSIVIDNTGAFRDTAGLSRHLKAKGVGKVLLTAPGKDSIPNIVFGVNHFEVTPEENDIFSAASCTTNAITPTLSVIEKTYGIEHGHIETIHAYTNDQNLVDNYHKKYRRGRAAAINMVITETGAGKAVAKAIPSLAGKLTSNAIRVPVPNGSLAILNLNLKKATSLEDLNKTLKDVALNGNLVEQIKYAVNNELVSSDIVGVPEPGIYDSHASIVTGSGKNILLYIWYDNEFGYTQQVIRLAKYIGKVRRFCYY